MAHFIRSAAFIYGFTAASAFAQYRISSTHNVDAAVGGTGQFTTYLSNEASASPQVLLNPAGLLLTFRDHSNAWAGFELNYQESSFSERFVEAANTSSGLQGGFHEASAAYLVHSHFRTLQPFVGAGGGALYYSSADNEARSWHGAGLAELGFDVPLSNPHFGFRAQARGLIYRAPDSGNLELASSRWIVTSEPSASLYIRF